MAHTFKSMKKPKQLPIADMFAAIAFNPEQAGFQERNLMPLDPLKLEGYKEAGEWDPSKPATYFLHEGKPVLLDGNTRTRYAKEAGFETGWFTEVELEGASLVDILKNRARSNIFTKNDPWTQAATFKGEFDQDMTTAEIAKNHGVSETTVKKALRLYELVKQLGPKVKAEETDEQKQERLKKAEDAQRKVIDGLRTGAISALDIDRLFAKDMANEEFDKALKTALRPKVVKAAAASDKKKAEKLDEYEQLGVPARFFPDLRAMIIAKSTLNEQQVQMGCATIDVIMGLLPRAQFLEGNFVPPAKDNEGEGEGSGDGEETDADVS